MKRVVILLSVVNLIFANTAKVNFVNNLNGLTFEVVNNDKVLVRLNEYKQISETFVLPNTPKISIYLDNRLVIQKIFKFEDNSTNTLFIDKSRFLNDEVSFSLRESSLIQYKDQSNLFDSFSDSNNNNFSKNVVGGENNEVRGIREINEVANVQIIHNSPYPVVDIYVDDAEALGDVPFRATTGMIQLPTSTTVGIAPANGDVIANFPFTLETNANYVVSASGILGNDATPFGLVASGLEIAAVDTNHFGLKVFHGVTDAPAVDIYANGILLVENLGYNEYKGYVQVPVGDYTIDVTAAGSNQSVASFAAPLAGFGGGTGIVFASGFLASQSDSSFSLILATPSGYSVSLPATTTALSTIADNIVSPSVFKLMQNYPNPFNPSTLIDFEVFETSKVSLNVYDLSGRLVKNLLSGNLNSGAYSIEWNGKNTNGISAAAGVYFYSISSGKSTLIKKMSLIK